MKRQAFTLVELLAVISIIGFLSTVAMIALNSTRAKARDTKRIADFRQIKIAMEMYFEANGVFPTCGMSTSCASTVGFGDFTQMGIRPAFMTKIPIDPINQFNAYGYYYQRGFKSTGKCTWSPTNDAFNYILITRLENPSAFPDSCPDGLPVAFDNPNLNYAISN